MKKERDTLRRIEALPEPRHLFILPDWIDSATLDRLIQQGYLTCQHHQRDANGAIHLAMGLQVTPKGGRLIQPQINWRQLALRGSLAGASFVVMSVLILYWG
ncbi:MAG TPA: hypothetical protein VGZ93_07000 [Candidatus Methylacidiphilales bacterium]|jgi:hypothetical protein|nr:hypothetical protein [Candidatus Methylacidiphilales bacterium]